MSLQVYIHNIAKNIIFTPEYDFKKYFDIKTKDLHEFKSLNESRKWYSH